MSTPTAMPGSGAGEPAKIGALGRVIGVLTNPKETFADIVRKPSWLAPVILSGVLGLAFAYVMSQRVDWHAFIRQQIEQSPSAANLSTEQINQRATGGARIAPIFGYVFGPLGGLIFSLWLGLIYWGAFNLFAGVSARFMQAWGVAAHAMMTTLVASPITILVMFLKEKGDVDPNNLLASSAGAFLANDAPQWMKSLGNSFELFWFWTLFLLATGFVAINPKKLAMGKALGIVIGVWLVGVLIKVGWTMAFS